jgi:hypothetical protein
MALLIVGLVAVLVLVLAVADHANKATRRHDEDHRPR